MGNNSSSSVGGSGGNRPMGAMLGDALVGAVLGGGLGAKQPTTASIEDIFSQYPDMDNAIQEIFRVASDPTVAFGKPLRVSLAKQLNIYFSNFEHDRSGLRADFCKAAIKFVAGGSRPENIVRYTQLFSNDGILTLTKALLPPTADDPYPSMFNTFGELNDIFETPEQRICFFQLEELNEAKQDSESTKLDLENFNSDPSLVELAKALPQAKQAHEVLRNAVDLAKTMLSEAQDLAAIRQAPWWKMHAAKLSREAEGAGATRLPDILNPEQCEKFRDDILCWNITGDGRENSTQFSKEELLPLIQNASEAVTDEYRPLATEIYQTHPIVASNGIFRFDPGAQELIDWPNIQHLQPFIEHQERYKMVCANRVLPRIASIPRNAANACYIAAIITAFTSSKALRTLADTQQHPLFKLNVKQGEKELFLVPVLVRQVNGVLAESIEQYQLVEWNEERSEYTPFNDQHIPAQQIFDDTENVTLLTSPTRLFQLDRMVNDAGDRKRRAMLQWTLATALEGVETGANPAQQEAARVAVLAKGMTRSMRTYFPTIDIAAHNHAQESPGTFVPVIISDLAGSRYQPTRTLVAQISDPDETLTLLSSKVHTELEKEVLSPSHSAHSEENTGIQTLPTYIHRSGLQEAFSLVPQDGDLAPNQLMCFSPGEEHVSLEDLHKATEKMLGEAEGPHQKSKPQRVTTRLSFPSHITRQIAPSDTADVLYFERKAAHTIEATPTHIAIYNGKSVLPDEEHFDEARIYQLKSSNWGGGLGGGHYYSLSHGLDGHAEIYVNDIGAQVTPLKDAASIGDKEAQASRSGFSELVYEGISTGAVFMERDNATEVFNSTLHKGRPVASVSSWSGLLSGAAQSSRSGLLSGAAQSSRSGLLSGAAQSSRSGLLSEETKSTGSSSLTHNTGGQVNYFSPDAAPAHLFQMDLLKGGTVEECVAFPSTSKKALTYEDIISRLIDAGTKEKDTVIKILFPPATSELMSNVQALEKIATALAFIDKSTLTKAQLDLVKPYMADVDTRFDSMHKKYLLTRAPEPEAKKLTFSFQLPSESKVGILNEINSIAQAFLDGKKRTGLIKNLQKNTKLLQGFQNNRDRKVNIRYQDGTTARISELTAILLEVRKEKEESMTENAVAAIEQSFEEIRDDGKALLNKLLVRME